MAHRDVVRIRGGRGGLSLVLQPDAPIDSVIQVLRQQIGNSPSFFAGATVRLECAGRDLTGEELALLARTVGEFGMELDTSPRPVAVERQPARERRSRRPAFKKEEGHEMAEYDGRALLVKRTLRSGQTVTFDGSVIIRGDVNPGAMVVSTGDIIVLGALRGVAHAGAEGDLSAQVIAFRLEPTQLRIGNIISRAPDEKGRAPGGPEVARVHENTILIEAYRP